MDSDADALIVDEQVFVITEGDRVAGLIVLRTAADHLLVENVAVDPDCQHCGNGRALLDFAAQHCRELGFDELRLYTNVAMTENLELYPRLGWSEYDRRVEDGFSRVYFRKLV
jgi:ribosomal protein S18 acetylase RimI-like enzyme